jgi:hypothetical protein
MDAIPPFPIVSCFSVTMGPGRYTAEEKFIKALVFWKKCTIMNAELKQSRLTCV